MSKDYKGEEISKMEMLASLGDRTTWEVDRVRVEAHMNEKPNRRQELSDKWNTGKDFNKYEARELFDMLIEAERRIETLEAIISHINLDPSKS